MSLESWGPGHKDCQLFTTGGFLKSYGHEDFKISMAKPNIEYQWNPHVQIDPMVGLLHPNKAQSRHAHVAKGRSWLQLYLQTMHTGFALIV